MDEKALTVVLSYTLKGSVGDFSEAISRLAERVFREGHPGLTSYRFFVNEVEHSARAVVEYLNPSAWLGHHEIAMGWPEMKALHGTAVLAEITFLGCVSAEMREWLATSGLSARFNEGYVFAAGFQR